MQPDVSVFCVPVCLVIVYAVLLVCLLRRRVGQLREAAGAYDAASVQAWVVTSLANGMYAEPWWSNKPIL